MSIRTQRLIIRDLERKDEAQLYKIVWQKNVVRFMKDWSEHSPSPESFHGYIDLPYLILTIDVANATSCKVAQKAGFELFEKRTPISHKQPNMESNSYFYYRKYRNHQSK